MTTSLQQETIDRVPLAYTAHHGLSEGACWSDGSSYAKNAMTLFKWQSLGFAKHEVPFVSTNLADRANSAMLGMQNELLGLYDQSGDTSLDRMKSVMDPWSELAMKLFATRSVPEAFQVYQKYEAQRMQMAAEDGRQLFGECQKITHKITRSLLSGWTSGIT